MQSQKRGHSKFYPAHLPFWARSCVLKVFRSGRVVNRVVAGTFASHADDRGRLLLFVVVVVGYLNVAENIP